MRVLLLFLTQFIYLSLHPQIITTFAGAGGCISGSGYCGDGGQATAAKANLPACGSFDAAGNYYFWHDGAAPHVRKVNTLGIITTVAGNGTQGNTGDGGPATNAQIWLGSVISDSAGNLYLSSNYSNNIRKVDVSTGLIHTICGNGTSTNTGDGVPATAATIIPYGMCFDKNGNLLVCASSYIRMINPSGIITTIAGNGLGGFSGDGGSATAAGISCHNICVDSLGNIYIGSVLRIRKIDISTGIITTYGGNGTAAYTGDSMPATAAQFREFGIAMDRHNNLYIADDVNDRIRMIDPLGIIHTVAGNGVAGYWGDGGAATDAKLWNPEGVAIDACGNLYIADDANNRIRKVTFNPTCDLATLKNKQVKTNDAMNVYPNPVNNELHIEGNEAGSYRLVSIVGAVVQEGKLSKGSNTVSVKEIPGGVYILEVTDEEGKRRLLKIIKQ